MTLRKKHPCPDCRMCRFCVDARCELCLGHALKAKYDRAPRDTFHEND